MLEKKKWAWINGTSALEIFSLPGKTKKVKSIFTDNFNFYRATKNTAPTGNNKHQKWDIFSKNRKPASKPAPAPAPTIQYWPAPAPETWQRHRHRQHNLKGDPYRHRNRHQKSKISRHRHRKAPTNLKQVFSKPNSQPYEPASRNWFINRKFQQASFF